MEHTFAFSAPRVGVTAIVAIICVGPHATVARLTMARQVAQASTQSITQLSAPFSAPIADMAASPVSLTTPIANASYVAPASIPLSATVKGSFTQVEFYSGSSLLGIVRTAPYTFTWNNVASGTYSVTAVGRNIRNAPTYSAAAQVVVKAATDFSLIQQTSLRYQGAFRVPAGPVGASSFGFGANMVYNPQRDSLFIVGHDWQQMVAEIKIPEVRDRPDVTQLTTATVLQTFADPTDGRRDSVNPTDPNGQKLGGLLPYGGRLIVSVYSYYDGAGSQRLSHFTSGMDLSVPNDATGPFQFSTLAGFISGYMGLIPSLWQGALGGPALVGNCCLSVISRTSYGPSVSSFNPDDVGTRNPIPSSTLLAYPAEHPLDGYSSTGTLFNGTSQVRGVVFPEGWRSVLFFGRHGLGTFCYGEGSVCNDPDDSDKGTHAYPYAYYVWAYDALQLAEVKIGAKQPWQVQPYGVWPLTLPFRNVGKILYGAAYDPATGRIFLSRAFGDSENPVILVYTLAN